MEIQRQLLAYFYAFSNYGHQITQFNMPEFYSAGWLSKNYRGVLNLAFVMGIVGLAVGLVIAMFIFGAVDNGIDCADIDNATGEDNCNDTKNNAWIVLGILPITLFFVLFRIFGGSFG